MGKIMTLPQVAEYLQFAVATVRRKVENGEIPGFKMGKEWRFSQDVIDKWIAENSKLRNKHKTAPNKREAKV